MYETPSIETQERIVSMPEEHTHDAGQAPEAKETIKTVQDEIFNKIGNDASGDATDYIEERKDRDAEARGEKLSPEREPKRDSGYKRMKRRALIAEAQKAIAGDLTKDVTALEGLVAKLLDQFERSLHLGITELDRARYRGMISDIRSHLIA